MIKNILHRKVSFLLILFITTIMSSCVQGDFFELYDDDFLSLDLTKNKQTKDVGGQFNRVPGCTGNNNMLGGCAFRTIKYVVNTRCGKSISDQSILNTMSEFVSGQTTSSTNFDYFSIRPCIARIISSVSGISENTLLYIMLDAKQYQVGNEISSVETFNNPFDASSASFNQGDIVLTNALVQAIN